MLLSSFIQNALLPSALLFRILSEWNGNIHTKYVQNSVWCLEHSIKQRMKWWEYKLHNGKKYFPLIRNCVTRCEEEIIGRKWQTIYKRAAQYIFGHTRLHTQRWTEFFVSTMLYWIDASCANDASCTKIQCILLAWCIKTKITEYL